MESKSCTIAVSIEPSLYALAVLESEMNEQALSAWARSAVIEKLHQSGRLNADSMLAILSGASVKVLQKLINDNRKAITEATAERVANS